MYQALYRKWRPRTFDDVVGQEHVTDTLKNQIINGRLSHAYLFIGTRGTGKTSCAKILAKAVNCEHPENGNPCNKCNSCLGIDDGSIMDVVELDAASNNGVDNVRALRDEAIYSPAVVKKRVYIIDEVHMLSSSAFNALLKILEEPPEHLLFILATTELHKVPATILSRCQRHCFKRIEPNLLAKRICYVAEQENMKIEPNAAELLARLADGSLRDGLSLLDQCSGNNDITTQSVLSAMGLAGKLRVAELLDAISNGDTAKSISIFGGLWSDGKAPSTLLSELNSLLRDILMLKVAPSGGGELLSGGFDKITLQGFAKRMTPEELICDIDSIQAHIGSLRDGRDPKTTAELCIIGLCEPELGDSIDSLKKRIAKLEAAFSSGAVTYAKTESGRQEQRNVEAKPIRDYKDVPPFEIDEKRTVSHEDNNPRENHEDVSYHENVEPQSEPASASGETFKADSSNEQSEETESGEAFSNVDDDERSFGSEETGGEWADILVSLKKAMQPSQYSLVSNEQMTKGELVGDTLTLSVSNAFVKGQIEQTQAMHCIKKAAQEIMGKAIMVKVLENKAIQSGNAGKLDGLSKFGNVKFE